MNDKILTKTQFNFLVNLHCFADDAWEKHQLHRVSLVVLWFIISDLRKLTYHSFIVCKTSPENGVSCMETLSVHCKKCWGGVDEELFNIVVDGKVWYLNTLNLTKLRNDDWEYPEMYKTRIYSMHQDGHG